MCTCQECGIKYKIDLIISDDYWKQIKPKGKAESAGLLCSSCIMQKLEAILEYNCFQLILN